MVYRDVFFRAVFQPDKKTAERHAMRRISCSDAKVIFRCRISTRPLQKHLREGRVYQEPWYLPICATSAVIFLSRILAGTLFRAKSLVASGGDPLCGCLYTGGDRNTLWRRREKRRPEHSQEDERWPCRRTTPGVSAGSVVLATNRSTSPSQLTDHPFFALRQMWSLCSASETRSFTFRVTLALNLKGTCERRVVGGFWWLSPEKKTNGNQGPILATKG